jgi:hypothetical protein
VQDKERTNEMGSELVKERPVLVESEATHLFVVFTEADIGEDDAFERWAAGLDALIGADSSWGGRFEADPDQRPGQFPRWRFMALFGITAEQDDARAVLESLEDAAGSPGADFAVWAYGAIGDFVKQSDGLLGSRGKEKLSPGAYRTSTRREA